MRIFLTISLTWSGIADSKNALSWRNPDIVSLRGWLRMIRFDEGVSDSVTSRFDAITGVLWIQAFVFKVSVSGMRYHSP